ncbi:MAG: hypothetical protein K2Y29_18460 [Beijerinckiaceae bacterium]|nr:hypothetical protein [Beijerinckiaceae bacterium]
MLFAPGRWLIGSQAGQVVLIVAAVLIALAGWTWKVARDARITVMERVLQETAAESSRRLQELNAVAAQSAAREVALAHAEAERAQLIGEIHALSQANNDRVCLPHSSVLRLDSLRRRTPGRGARKPGG